jgi:hypothetical protein
VLGSFFIYLALEFSLVFNRTTFIRSGFNSQNYYISWTAAYIRIFISVIAFIVVFVQGIFAIELVFVPHVTLFDIRRLQWLPIPRYPLGEGAA